jgi:hypothetical protein
VIRPEGDEPLDEAPFTRDALGQRGVALGRSDVEKPTACVLTGLLIRLTGRAECANRIGDGAG